MAEKLLSRFRRVQLRVQSVLDEMGIISRDESEMHWLEKFAHFWVMVGKSFWRNRCPVRASALAYTTLLALVPLLAVGISISTGLLKREGGKEQIEQFISGLVAKVAPQLDLVAKSAEGEQTGTQKVAENISAYINNVSSGTMGATAIIVLVFVAISLLSTIEAALNDIWGVTQGRTWLARIEKYWAVICFGPILLLLIMGLNLGPYFTATLRIDTFNPVIGNMVHQFLPLLMLILFFSGFYHLMPNTKVNWRAALVGGIVGGCLWYLNNKFSTIYLGQVVRNSEIYGKLAILPVFLIGIYLSWLIVLFGAQVAYAFQNRRAYIQERQAENVNERGREFVALRLMTFIAQQFHWGERPPSSAEIAESLCVPSQLVSKVMQPLLQSNLLLCVASRVPNETAYTPARPLDQISYQDILDSIRAGIGQELETRDEPSRTVVRVKFNEILAAEREVAGSITLRMLVKEEKIG